MLDVIGQNAGVAELFNKRGASFHCCRLILVISCFAGVGSIFFVYSTFRAMYSKLSAPISGASCSTLQKSFTGFFFPIVKSFFVAALTTQKLQSI